jgi:membrane protein DedA with SNARE-associated domain
MNEFMQFLIQYGYVLLFLWILLDQAGLPLPSIPVLLAAGALCGNNQLDFWLVVSVSIAASVPVDYMWYYMGRARGGKVLTLLCSISLEPDYCVRNTAEYFDRFGQFSLLIAKFIPGLQTIAPPMAGFTKMPISRFLILDILGAAFWSGSVVLLGLIFHQQLEVVALQFAELGGWAVAILLLGFGIYLTVKIVQRQLFLRTLRTRRMGPTEAYEMLNSDTGAHIIDLRHRLDVDAMPVTLPSATRIPMEFIDDHYEKIPKDKDIILYCS